MTFSEAAISSHSALNRSQKLSQAIAAMGGTAGQLSNGLWQARGDEFSVEKADFGYMAWGIRGPYLGDPGAIPGPLGDEFESPGAVSSIGVCVLEGPQWCS